jgi:hypothetical protein
MVESLQGCTGCRLVLCTWASTQRCHGVHEDGDNLWLDAAVGGGGARRSIEQRSVATQRLSRARDGRTKRRRASQIQEVCICSKLDRIFEPYHI